MSRRAAQYLVAEAAIRRARRVDSVLELIGQTPLIRLRNMEPRENVEIWAKAEFMNPGGSVKDRAALMMMKDAIADGRLGPGKTLIDSSSGNTGVAYSLIGAALGVKVALVLPENVTFARKAVSAAFGTQLIFSSGLEGSDGAIKMVRELVAAEPDRWFYPDQYSNESNPRAHELGTAPEIDEVLGDRLTHFVAGVGTSGTVMGVGRYFKRVRPNVEIIALEPDDEFHGLEGMKHMASSIVPAIWRPSEAVDRVMPVSTDEGWDTSEKVARAEGLFVGHSAGANIAGAIRVALSVPPSQKACIVTILADRGDRYFTPLKWEQHYEW